MVLLNSTKKKKQKKKGTTEMSYIIKVIFQARKQKLEA